MKQARKIQLDRLNETLLAALPELRDDLQQYERCRMGDPEFTQSFFSYSFIPTLQSALDRGVREFCTRAFGTIEELLTEGDERLRGLLDDEFFGYGPHCEGWMEKAGPYMGPRTRTIAEQIVSRR